MTNNYGIRHEISQDNLGLYRTAWARKDVSSLNIVMPFTISVRARVYVDIVDGIGTFQTSMQIGSNGLEDWHGIFIQSSSDDAIDLLVSFANEPDNETDGTTNQANAITDPGTDWVWMQMHLEKDGSNNPILSWKFAETDNTSIPSTWDTTGSESTVVNVLASDVLQTIDVRVEIYSTAGNKEVIAEIDEIHVVQD